MLDEDFDVWNGSTSDGLSEDDRDGTGVDVEMGVPV